MQQTIVGILKLHQWVEGLQQRFLPQGLPRFLVDTTNERRKLPSTYPKLKKWPPESKQDVHLR